MAHGYFILAKKYVVDKFNHKALRLFPSDKMKIVDCYFLQPARVSVQKKNLVCHRKNTFRLKLEYDGARYNASAIPSCNIDLILEKKQQFQSPFQALKCPQHFPKLHH